MKRRTGYVFFDEKYKVYRGRITYKDVHTDKRRERWVTGKTQTEAWDNLDKLRVQLKANNGQPVAKQKLKTFAELAEAFRTERIIPAVFRDGKKVAGYKDTTTPLCFLEVLIKFFGKKKLNSILPKDVEAFKMRRLQAPTKYDRAAHSSTSTRAIASVNRELEFLRSILCWGEENAWLTVTENPFSKKSTRRLIERSHETKRERFPTFGEDLAILAQCIGDRSHLHDVLILGADTGMRRGEIVGLSWLDVDLAKRVIRIRSEISKTNRERTVPMTERVHALLTQRQAEVRDLTTMREYPGLKKFTPNYDLVFFGLREFKRSFNTACRLANVVDLHFHDYSRHAFVTRTILAGIPPAVVLKASGHSSDEWKRYLNVSPDSLRGLWIPLPGQSADEVKAYGSEVTQKLVAALNLEWYGQADSMPKPKGQALAEDSLLRQAIQSFQALSPADRQLLIGLLPTLAQDAP